MAEDFGVQGRGAFYDQTGAIRDVVQNHLFQILTNLAMEPPVRMDSESIRDEKVKVLKAIAPIEAKNLVRGQFRGYLVREGRAAGFDSRDLRRAEAGGRFLALAGRSLLHPRREVPAGHLHGSLSSACGSPPDDYHSGAQVDIESSPASHQPRRDDRRRHDGQISPEMRWRGEADRNWWRATIHTANEMDAYERVLGDAMAGDTTLFAREDYVEEAWRIVDPVLRADTPVYEYEPGTWGPAEVNQSIVPPGGWHVPVAEDPARDIQRAA